MRVPIRWLSEFVELPREVSVEELAHRLTMAGIEVGGVAYVGLAPRGEGTGLHARWVGEEGVERAGVVWDPERLVVGEVLEVNPHPNADRLAVAAVGIGEETLQSVHGAPNLPPGARGQKVAVALPGTRIKNAYGDGLLEVKEIKLRGVASQAVICSEKELGLSEDHSGVLLLDGDAPVGAPLSEYLGDVVLELDLTPNLGRCLSIVGVAREAAALTGSELRIEEPSWTTEGEPIQGQARLEIEDPELCPRYTAALIRDLESRPTPFWMRYRLMLSGVRPINLVVDVTNYVMLEWGQPLHAFDYEKLVERAAGEIPTVVVRRARTGERITTLDEVKRELKDDMLVIADVAGPIAVAGVMGGRETEVSPETRHVLLESANFHAINNRRTAQALELPSEASRRFSRGVPPQLADRAARRAAELLRELAGGTIAGGLLDAYPSKPEPRVIRLRTGEVERLLGAAVGPSEIVEVLQRLDFACRARDGEIEVTVPDHRLDVEIPADLVEEVARVIGYDRLPSTLLREELPPQRLSRSLELEERVRDLLAGCGLTEAINYALTSVERVARLHPEGEPPREPHLELANPISQERTHLRRTLLDGLLANVSANQRHRERIALFEVGPVYLPDEESELPQEPRRLGIALAGPRGEPSWAERPAPVSLFDLKGIIEALLARLHVEGARVGPVDRAFPAFHPGRAAALLVGGEPLGTLGEVHPKVAERFELKGRVYAAELDLERLLELAGELRAYRPIPRFPGVRMDLAVVVDQDLPAERVEGVIREHGGQLLREVQLFDVYSGAQVPEGQKSLAYSLLYQAEDRTLTDEEAQTIHARIQEALETELKARVRGFER